MVGPTGNSRFGDGNDEMESKQNDSRIASHKPTVEELHSNKYNIPELGEIYLEILDTSGTFEFPAMRRLSIEKGDAFILVFSMDNGPSWEEIKHLRQLILEEKQDQVYTIDGQTANASAQTKSGHRDQNQESQKSSSRQSLASSGHRSGTPTGSAAPAAARSQTPSILTDYSIRGAPKRADRRLSLAPVGSMSSQNRAISNLNSLLPASELERPLEQEATSTRPYYNSQLSKLLQQQQQQPKPAPGSKTGSRLLKHSISNDDDDNDDDDDDGGDGEDNDNDRSSARAVAASGLLGADSEPRVNFAPNLNDSPRAKSKSSFGAGRACGEPGGGPILRCRTPIVVVANKCDLEESLHEIELGEVEDLVCNVWGNSFVKCSAKEPSNVDRVFKELLKQARAPEVLSKFVIDDHQQRRQSLPVLKSHLSAQHVRGLRNLYNQQQQQQLQPGQKGARDSARLLVEQSSGSGSEDNQCRII